MTDLLIPEGRTADVSLWTPTEVRHVQSWVAASEGGRHALKHEFQLSYMGETVTFGVLAEEGEGDALIEDMAGGMAEREMVKILERQQKRGSKLIPEQLAGKTHERVRHELAAAMRDYIKAAKKRALSNGKRYYAGASL